MRPAWGKFDRDSGETHSLAHHCMDVAAVFSAMLRLPVVRERLETAAGTRLDRTLCRKIGALVFLHDVGKLHPAFQAKGWPRECGDGRWGDTCERAGSFCCWRTGDASIRSTRRCGGAADRAAAACEGSPARVGISLHSDSIRQPRLRFPRARGDRSRAWRDCRQERTVQVPVGIKLGIARNAGPAGSARNACAKLRKPRRAAREAPFARYRWDTAAGCAARGATVQRTVLGRPSSVSINVLARAIRLSVAFSGLRLLVSDTGSS